VGCSFAVIEEELGLKDGDLRKCLGLFGSQGGNDTEMEEIDD
jgi:hypothetical protein